MKNFASSLQLGPQHLDPSGRILTHHPTKNIPHKLYRPKMIIPIPNNNRQTEQHPIPQKDIKHEQLRRPLKYNRVVLDLELTELGEQGKPDLGCTLLWGEGWGG